MAKFMRPRIDDVDRAILECLREDARMYCSEIARRLGNMTSRAISNRLHRLVKEGFIKITAGAVPEKLGFVIRAELMIEVEPGMIQEVAQSLVSLDRVNYVATTTGDADISASVVVTTMEDLQAFLSNRLHSIPGIRRTKTHMVTTVLKNDCEWSFPETLLEV